MTVTRGTRRPPMPQGLPRNGACRWCAAPILHPPGHKLAGQPNARRTWCSEKVRDCVWRYKLATDSATQRAHCWKRDGGRCACCGAEPTYRLSVGPARVTLGWHEGYTYGGIPPGHAHRWVPHDMAPEDWIAAVAGPFEPIVIQRLHSKWDADHIRPLWSAPRDLSVADRDAWFGPDNLQTLCAPCHKAKSAREAAARAGQKRAARPPAPAPLLECSPA